MAKHGVPMTRQNYIDASWPQGVPDPWGAEHEEQLPEPFRVTVTPGPELETPVAPPNILGSEYDQLPAVGGRGYTPQESVDKAINDAASAALAKGTYRQK